MFIFQTAKREIAISEQVKPRINLTNNEFNMSLDGLKAEYTKNGATFTEKNVMMVNVREIDGRYMIEKKDERTGKVETKTFDKDDKKGIQQFVNNDKIFERLFDWIQENFEETREKFFGSKISKVKNPSPIKISDDVRKANKFTEEGEKATAEVAKEYSPLKTKAKKEKNDADNAV